MGEFADEVSAQTDGHGSLTLWQLLVHHPESADERINLRLWFGGFLVYMIALTVGIFVGLHLAYSGVTGRGTALFVSAGMMFYLSLCCTIVPLPTAWIILAVGSGEALKVLLGPEWAQALDGMMGGWMKVAVVAVLGGLATTMANLNEYHVFTFLLRYKKIGKVRETRLHDWAGKWFGKGPFVLLATFCFVPIPVDVVRWLAVSNRYPRGRFFAANMVGRGSRYALMAVFSSAMGLGIWSILAIQAGLGLVAGQRVLARMRAKKAGNKEASRSV